jgi:hypothetical protein
MSAIKAGDDLGDGLVAVPIEPTPRMIEMARTCLKRLPDDQRWMLTMSHRRSHEIKMRARWKAMIEVAGHVLPDFDGRTASATETHPASDPTAGSSEGRRGA